MPAARLLLPCLLVFAGFLPAARSQERAPVFGRTGEVMKVLQTRCLECHVGAKRRGGLDISTRELLLQGGDSGAAIEPGKAGKSLLYRLVTHAEEPAMPQKGTPLTQAQTALLAAWIDAGAPYDRALNAGSASPKERWWALRPVVKPALPRLSPELQARALNPIDLLVMDKLRERGLTPSAPAQRRVLLRRVTFDLIGLPPTPEEIDAFVRDSSSDAYEKVVDRLLASPRYGERWARHWMDLVHFAETHGHDQDVPRDYAWPYRDYLIASFNADKPYGRFVQEQIAGDVLFPADPQAVVALGCLAAGPWDESSLRDIREDSIDRKAAQYLDRDDIVGTVGLTFLSTSVQCARCHDHKFDPVTQKEYYGLQAVFAGTDRANRAYDADPAVHARRQALLARKRLTEQGPAGLARLRGDAQVMAELAGWEKAQVTADPWRTLEASAHTTADGCEVVSLRDGSFRFAGTRPERDCYTFEAITDGTPISAVRLEVLTDERLPHGGPGRQDNGNLHLSEFRIEAAPASNPSAKQLVKIERASADFNQAGWEIDKAIDGKKETAWGIYPAVGQSHNAVFVLKTPVSFPGGTRLTIALDQQHGTGHLIGRLRLAVTGHPAPDALTPMPANVRAVLAKSPASRNEGEWNELLAFGVLRHTEAALAALPPPRLVYAGASDFQPDGSFRPARGCRPVNLLRRGDVRNPAEPASPGALACIAEVPFTLADTADEGQRRAALARWISDPRNPLTWRSIANRVWHYHFGRGLVATPNDFGHMGSLPSHPELLDWLTATLLEDGGSLKKLQRLIVTSATYRQGAQPNAEAARVDADNVLFWRMNVQRLDAESVRDAVLQVSGKLDTTMGGPSVKHFNQSPGIHRTPKVDYSAFDPDAAGAHRRSVYRFVFRTVPDPFLDALDCPDASQFVAARAESVTALQALALLNDPFMVRMSEHFARRLTLAGDTRAQVRLAYRLALGRDATEGEVGRLAGYAERRGMANACRLLLNCNEFVFVE